MRDKNRIPKFCNELGEIWMENCPDWRFGQLVLNVLGEMSINRDPFFPEEDEMIKFFKTYFEINDEEKS